MIKNFIYLDEDKMYSLSSQIFEGVTEYILNENGIDSSKAEEQKIKPIGSGKIIGDVLRTTGQKTEKKFLHDYSYSLFENHLLQEKKVIDTTKSKKISSIDNGKFIKIKANAFFNDINSIQITLDKFNELGKALTHMVSLDEITKNRQELEILIENTKDKAKKTTLKNKLKSQTDVAKLAKEQGLYRDPEFLKDMSLVFSYGFQDQLEVKMGLLDTSISANLKRDFLREKEELLIRKYSRKTEMEFVLFGLVTQCGSELTDASSFNNPQSGEKSLKVAALNLANTMTSLEAHFSGRLDNEIIIDPIALYTEL